MCKRERVKEGDRETDTQSSRKTKTKTAFEKKSAHMTMMMMTF